MINSDDAMTTYEYPEYYKILPQIHDWAIDSKRIKNGKRVPDGFVYSSDLNTEWMSIGELQAWIKANRNQIGGY